jgi:sec-independent protein translocase protein TatB
MFGMSFTELVIIAILALILLGPDRLPDAARSAGKLMRELRRATDDIKDQLETEIYSDDSRRRPTVVPPVPVAPPPAAAGPEAADAQRPDPEADSPYPEPRTLPARPEPGAAAAPAPAPPADAGQAPKA